MFATPSNQNSSSNMEEAYGESTAFDSNGFLKRKRSNSPERPVPAKITKTLPGANIDFLASVQAESLPLVDTEDSLRFIQQHFEAYSGVIERHESLAANLGAKLLAPNSIKRFERMFMNDIKILANHGKEGNTVTWLDIVKFYDDKPGFFKLVQKDGQKVCQFYTKQCRVEISEDEYEFIQSGQPQKMLPSGTVPADEEKELGTIEFMETKIGQIIKLADQVSGRGKQLMSRLKARRNALAAKRDAEVNGGQIAATATAASTTTADASPSENRSGSPVLSGFTAVNAQRDIALTNGGITTTSSFSKPLVSAAVKAELSAIFAGTRDRSLSSGGGEYPIRSSKSRNRGSDYGHADVLLSAVSPAQPPTPGIGPVPPGRPAPAEKADNDGPFKAEMLSRMEKMNRYAIVKPPCDRCRRLQMDCQKNLTACLGCTKKHAKCSWKEVSKQELIDNPAPQASAMPLDLGRRESMSGSDDMQGGNRTPVPVLDRELLGEDDSDDDDMELGMGARDTPAPPSSAYGLPQNDGAGEQTQLRSSPHGPDTNLSSLNSHSNAQPATPYSPPSSRAETASVAAGTHQAGQSLKAESTSGAPGYSASSAVAAETSGSGIGTHLTIEHDDHIKAEHSQQHQQLPPQQQRLPGFPQILSDRMVDNSTVLGAATGDRLAREAQGELERLQPDSAAQQQKTLPGMNGTTAV